MSARLLLAAAVIGLSAPAVPAADWPHWLGPNRDAKVADFKAPDPWPKALAKKWSVKVGDGVATPALVGDKLYVFAREGGDEVLRCLKADSGDEVWKDKHPARQITGPAQGFPGPRSSPAVADGVVVTLGVQGALSGLDAATGKKLWRKDSTGSVPNFATSSSPLLVDGLCVMQYGGERSGGVAAYDLKTGEEKWKWDGDGTAYASPVPLSVDGAKVIAVETGKTVAAVSTAGKKLWDTPFAVVGRGYNASTPMTDGATLVYSGSGRGTRAVKVEKKGDALAATELWANKDHSVMYNTPVVKDGMVYGLASDDTLFCIDAKAGTTVWTTKAKGAGGRTAGYGSIVDAGAVLFLLNPAGDLVAFAPGGKEYKEVARYPVGGSYAYPVITGQKVYVKDKDAVTLWAFE
jgi:outer membrane protein assembly factor BamB